MRQTKLFQQSLGVALSGAVCVSLLLPLTGKAQMTTSPTATPDMGQQSQQGQMTPYDQMTTPTTQTSQQVYTVPAGTSLTIRETGGASTGAGSNFTGELINPIQVNGMQIIPAGSTVSGQVVSSAAGARDIRLSSITLPSGNTVAFVALANAPTGYSVAAVQQEPLQGGVQSAASQPLTFYPHVTFMERPGMSPAAKVVSGTVGGAALGAGIGTLTGLTMKVTDSNAYNIGKGSATVRGLAWGSAYGAGLGLLSGLIAAAATPSPVAVTSTGATPVATTATAQPVVVTLTQPATVML